MKNYQSGMGVTGRLFIVFVVLKLTGYINWSWWWITAPLWGPAVLFIAIAIIAIAIGTIIAMMRR